MSTSASAAPDHGWCTAPNALTLARLLALPAVLWLFHHDHYSTAAALFLAAMSTDAVDGWIARRFHQSSRLGMYLDAVIDKIVVVAMLYELARASLLPWLIPHLFLTRELLHNAVRSTAASQGRVVGANWMGKTKGFLQTLLITAGLLLPALPNPPYLLFHSAAWITLALSWSFFIRFTLQNHSLLKS
jgi:CDP-diacylglycerol--glycerol-3-phosphate 3-phosphatidyltransferase